MIAPQYEVSVEIIVSLVCSVLNVYASLAVLQDQSVDEEQTPDKNGAGLTAAKKDLTRFDALKKKREYTSNQLKHSPIGSHRRSGS